MSKKIHTVTCIAVALTIFSFATTDATANSVAKASYGSAGGSVAIARGGSQILVSGGQLVVDSIRTVAQGTEVVLRNSATGLRTSLMYAGTAADKAGWVIGQSVKGIATGSGTILAMGGRAIAFVPNEIGRRLSHYSRY